MTGPTTAGVARLAVILCNDPYARIIAKAEDQPLYEDSAADVQEYWLTIAATAVEAIENGSQSNAG